MQGHNELLNRIAELEEACADALVAIGHIGVERKYKARGEEDGEAFKFLVQLQFGEEGGVDKILENAFKKLQKVMKNEPTE